MNKVRTLGTESHPISPTATTTMMPTAPGPSRSPDIAVSSPLSPSPAATAPPLPGVLSPRTRERLSTGSSPPLLFLDDAAAAGPNAVFVPLLDTGAAVASAAALRASSSAELCPDAVERSTTASSQSPAAVNPLRSLNPAFSLSPRTASGSGLMRVSSTPSVVIHTDKERPMLEHRYVVGTVEDRRNFVGDCLLLAQRMSTERIVEELLPAMLIAANYDDSVESIAELLPGVVRQTDSRRGDVFIHFLGLIMHMCCTADHAVVRRMSHSLVELACLVGDSITAEFLLPLVFCMRGSFWSSPRAVAAGLLGAFAARPALIEASAMSVLDWFRAFASLARDECHFVREVAVGALHQWVEAAEVHGVHVAEMPLPLIHECLADEQSDNVRNALVAELARLSTRMGAHEATKYLQAPFLTAARDASWRVRFVAARHVGVLAQASDSPDGFFDAFAAVCADEEHAVRAAAAEQISDVLAAPFVSPDVRRRMCLLVAMLACDREAIVRGSVAANLHTLLAPGIAADYSPELRRILVSLLADADFAVARCAIQGMQRVVGVLCRCIRPEQKKRRTREIKRGERRSRLVKGEETKATDGGGGGGGASSGKNTERMTREGEENMENNNKNNKKKCPVPEKHKSSSRRHRGSRSNFQSNGSNASVTSTTTNTNTNTVVDTLDIATGTGIGSGSDATTASSTKRISRRFRGTVPSSHLSDSSAVHRPATPLDSFDVTTHSPSPALSSAPDDAMESPQVRSCAAGILSGIINHLRMVSESNNWRVREAVVVTLSHFGGVLSEEEFVPLAYVIRSLLRDPVSRVRQCAAKTMSIVAAAFGPEWAALMTFDLLRKEFVMDTATYVWRVLAIECLSNILPVVDGLSPNDLRRHELMHQWVRMIVGFSQDAVSNVRLALAKSIAERVEWYAACSAEQEEVWQCVERLQKDSDVDVARAAAGVNIRKLSAVREPF